MSRLIIAVQPDLESGGYFLFLQEPASDAGWAPRRFVPSADPVPAQFRDGVCDTRQMGAYVTTGLRLHPAIGQQLDQLLAAAPNAEPCPIYFHISADTELLPWETLFDHDEFLALDRRWPVARLGGGGTAPTSAVFESQLRVMAILSAATVPAADEWTALFSALKRATYPVSVRVLVAEPELAETIKQAAHPNLSISCDWVPGGRDILAEIEDAQPHLLHLFGHGRVNHGFGEIQLATRASWPNEDDPDHVVLEPGAFARLTSLAAPWVMTMNVCRGAQAGDTGSLVYSMLSTGFPAVAGMREPVGERVAHAFTKGFYGSLVRRIGDAVPGGGRLDLELPAALHEARLEICEQFRNAVSCRDSAATQREWTLPVLYVQSPGLSIERRTAPPPGPVEVAAGVPDPAATARTTAESKLAFLKDLLAAGLPGVDEGATAAIKAEVSRLEAALYEVPVDVPA